MAVSAVATTGIYCRPECSASPLPHNTSSYSAPIAAEAAGYRPCLRCRPDRHLRSVEVTDAPLPVRGAVELISAGFLDRFDEAALADRVGYSTRQLRRLFEQHVGATPDFVARSRRAHFARRLLDETDLSMTVIAGAAGFGSVRQMNRVVEQIFRFTPRELRAKRRARDVLAVDGGLQLRIPTGSLLDVDQIVAHLAPRLTPGVESLEGTTYRRTVNTCGHPGVVEIDLAASAEAVQLVAHLPTFDSIIDEVARVRHMFGFDDDLDAAHRHLASDPALGRLVRRRPNLRVIGGWDRFETAVRVIVGQQVSVVGATTTTGGLVERYGTPLSAPALGLTHLFPTPEQLAPLASATTNEGMPRRRAATIGALAEAVLDGRVDLHAADPDHLRRQLVALPGIGPWTAEVVTMRASRDADVFPAGDLGIRQAVAALDELDDLPSEADCRDRAAAWSPHRSIAAQHLWASLTLDDPSTQEMSA
jgi:AraC family transcriptional regulator of adaptative response / DNA-3-methyladenine glycosylase II